MFIASTINPFTKSSSDVPVIVLVFTDQIGNATRRFTARPTQYTDLVSTTMRILNLATDVVPVFRTSTLDVCRGEWVEIDDSAYGLMYSYLDEVQVSLEDAVEYAKKRGITREEIVQERTEREEGTSRTGKAKGLSAPPATIEDTGGITRSHKTKDVTGNEIPKPSRRSKFVPARDPHSSSKESSSRVVIKPKVVPYQPGPEELFDDGAPLQQPESSTHNESFSSLNREVGYNVDAQATGKGSQMERRNHQPTPDDMTSGNSKSMPQDGLPASAQLGAMNVLVHSQQPDSFAFKNDEKKPAVSEYFGSHPVTTNDSDGGLALQRTENVTGGTINLNPPINTRISMESTWDPTRLPRASGRLSFAPQGKHRLLNLASDVLKKESPYAKAYKEGDERFTVTVHAPKPNGAAEFKIRKTHSVKKVLEAACKTFSLDYERARLLLLEGEGEQSNLYVCDSTDTIETCGVLPDSCLLLHILGQDAIYSGLYEDSEEEEDELQA